MGAGLVGPCAEAFIRENGLTHFEISPAVQLRLLEIAYSAEETEARRLCTKSDVTARYGTCDWDNLDPAIRTVLVDLKFRGDYTPAARRHIQPAIVHHDGDAFLAMLEDRNIWVTVPQDRFARRVEYFRQNRKTGNVPVGEH